MKDFTFDPERGEFCVAPSASFEEMECSISDDDSKEVEMVYSIEPISKFDNLEDSIMQDEESKESF